MLAVENLNAGSLAAALGLWCVMYVDTVEMEYIPVGDWVVKYVDGEMVPTPAKYTAFALERLEHPLPPYFSARPGRYIAQM
jgi:hypothetical protein